MTHIMNTQYTPIRTHIPRAVVTVSNAYPYTLRNRILYFIFALTKWYRRVHGVVGLLVHCLVDNTFHIVFKFLDVLNAFSPPPSPLARFWRLFVLNAHHKPTLSRPRNAYATQKPVSDLMNVKQKSLKWVF